MTSSLQASLTFRPCSVFSLQPLTRTQLNVGKVIAVGPGGRTREGSVIPVAVKEGDTVLLPEYGGSHIKMEDKEYVLHPPLGSIASSLPLLV